MQTRVRKFPRSRAYRQSRRTERHLPRLRRLKAHRKESNDAKKFSTLHPADRRDRAGTYAGGSSGLRPIQTDNYNIETSVTGLTIILDPRRGGAVCDRVDPAPYFPHRPTRAAGSLAVNAAAPASRPNRRCLSLPRVTISRLKKFLMSKNADHAEQPVVNYLLAAEAAQQRGDEARANQHLERAAELAQGDPIPVEITRVRSQLARNENHAARHGIDRLLEVAPRHPEVRLAEQAYIRTGAWGSLLDIIPLMAKAEVGDDEHRDELPASGMDWPDGSGARRPGQRRSENVVEESEP